MPKLTFGICPRCGRSGVDDDGNKLTGYELIDFRGEWMCEICKIQIEDQEHDELSNEKHIEQEEFFNAIGVKNEVQ